MNCKGSPNSVASTGMPVSPARKVKFSRKFKIDLTEDSVLRHEAEKTDDIKQLEKKLLRYRRKCREKQMHYDELIKNKTLLNEVEVQRNREVRMLTSQLEEEARTHQNLMEINSQVTNMIQQAMDKIDNDANKSNLQYLRVEAEESKSSAGTYQLEILQEKLFISNKKESDLERMISREQKKNENLSKELRNLKIDIKAKFNQ